jgi:hypothetical protein
MGMPANAIKSASYTKDQVDAIVEVQIPKHALATRLAYESGVKASEIATLRPPLVRTLDPVGGYEEHLFAGRKDIVIYSVHPPKGVARQVSVSRSLAKKLELARLARPARVQVGEEETYCGYDIGYGHPWVHNFAEASDIALGFSHGTQGLRHAYIQERSLELTIAGYSHEDRVNIIALETGLQPNSVERYATVGRVPQARL